MNWFFMDTGPNLGIYNMAIDEEHLARAQAGERTPVLRFYGWQPPTVSIGRFQKIDNAVNAEACRELGIDIVRRVTGGRAVLHNHELTYSIIARTDHPQFPPNVLGTYKVIAAGLLTGLRILGIPAEMVSRENRNICLMNKDTRDASCFSSPSWYEIVVHGKKIIGSAQRRLSGAFLQHGSILMDYDPVLEARAITGSGTLKNATCIQRELKRNVTLEEVKKALQQGFVETLGVEFTHTS